MTTLAFPTLSRFTPSELSDWALNSNTRVHRSQFTGTRKSIAIPGSWWSVVSKWESLTVSDRAELEAFVAELGGSAGLFYYSHPMWRLPRGTARGTGTCAAAAQFATTLVLSGAGIGAGVTLLKADFIEVQVAGASPVLVRVSSNATESAGSITVLVQPMLRIAVPSSTPFTLVRPRGQFALVSDKQSMPVRRGDWGRGLGDFTLDAAEAF